STHSCRQLATFPARRARPHDAGTTRSRPPAQQRSPACHSRPPACYSRPPSPFGREVGTPWRRRHRRGPGLVLAELAGERDDATAQELHGRLRERARRHGLAVV
ncbi:MAG: hypothetical protein M3312_04545, partial [Actinomycetota bacterium]|nr:hypothetical protein [Actinomycetota bacterium]